jgi:hypothetical protein
MRGYAERWKGDAVLGPAVRAHLVPRVEYQNHQIPEHVPQAHAAPLQRVRRRHELGPATYCPPRYIMPLN